MPARTPEDCDNLLGEYLAAGALPDILALYEPQAVFFTQDRQRLAGRDAIATFFGPTAAVKPRLLSTIVQVLRSGDDLAMIYNDWTLTATAPDGTVIEQRGKAIEVVRRQADGSWRFAIDDPFARDA
ncbi:MAG: SgcJ/EcaC family oxidoreductase [Deltaproteobacteria bacterium]|nr:SgcJ/EcaC family oxidoreductase [Deltaproteobacteria bacterium]